MLPSGMMLASEDCLACNVMIEILLSLVSLELKNSTQFPGSTTFVSKLFPRVVMVPERLIWPNRSIYGCKIILLGIRIYIMLDFKKHITLYVESRRPLLSGINS